jgi:DNA-binding transcriptional LysR family regulator
MMYNPQLETFLRVADAGSFSKAADLFYITPTAVIKQINILEADLGMQLFVRTHRGISLTESGMSLYNDTKYLIQYSKDSVERARNVMQGIDNLIRIGTSPMTPGQFLVDLWPRLYEQCPEIKFKLVMFENTPETAREILGNFGKHIDIVAGWFDDDFLRTRECAALELSREPVRCAVPVGHRLASKDKLTIQDLYGEKLMLNRRIWNSYVNKIREDLLKHHNQISIVDFEFYDVNIFNQCENENAVLMTFDAWKNVHPLLKILPVEWEHTIPFGVLHSPSPTKTVQKFLSAVQAVLNL